MCFFMNERICKSLHGLMYPLISLTQKGQEISTAGGSTKIEKGWKRLYMLFFTVFLGNHLAFWWRKFCITWHVESPVNSGINHDELPSSTGLTDFSHQAQYQFNRFKVLGRGCWSFQILLPTSDMSYSIYLHLDLSNITCTNHSSTHRVPKQINILK